MGGRIHFGPLKNYEWSRPKIARAVYNHVVSPRIYPMPRLLEVAQNCQRYNTHPGAFGFDHQDPRVMRDINTCLNVYEAAMSHKQAKKKIDWEKENPAGKALLRWAREGKDRKSTRLNSSHSQISY